MKRSLASPAIVLACALLVSCGSGALRWTPDYHTVRSGETLYSIAMQYNLDVRQLSAWNQLGDGTLIRSGQRLRLSPPPGGSAVSTGSSGSAPRTSSGGRSGSSGRSVSTPPTPVSSWRWPTQAPVALRFGESQKTESGIRFQGREGQPVLAAASGEVVYSGSGLKGYGQLLIIKHNPSYLSAYGQNSKLLVREGEKVRIGQEIARMGRNNAGKPSLHFEIRRNGQPVDPLRYLPRR